MSVNRYVDKRWFFVSDFPQGLRSMEEMNENETPDTIIKYEVNGGSDPLESNSATSDGPSSVQNLDETTTTHSIVQLTIPSEVFQFKNHISVVRFA